MAESSWDFCLNGFVGLGTNQCVLMLKMPLSVYAPLKPYLPQITSGIYTPSVIAGAGIFVLLIVSCESLTPD
jgi:hypothetical protein